MNTESLCVEVAALTHPGKVRSHNEDCIVVDGWLSQDSMDQPQTFVLTLEEPLLCLVADGMGGHAAGEIASRFAARRLSKETPNLAMGEAALAEGLRRLHEEFYTEMLRSPAHSGMGTTVAGLIFSQTGILAFNVGDSRIYCYQENNLAQLSTDDVPQGSTPVTGHLARRTHAITQSLGGFAEVLDITPHIVSHRLEAGRYYLLCSDGVTDMLAVDTIATCVFSDPSDTVSALFEKAMAAGGKDNITIVAVRVQPEA
jgi:serine/threonine protein phosphatase PrpC